MTEEDARSAELDRLLNDPEVALEPDRVWALLHEQATRCGERPSESRF